MAVNSVRSVQGLTVLETVVAIAVCAIVLGGLAVVSSSALREGRAGTYKTQSTQILSAVGRQIAGGEDYSLLLPTGEDMALTGSDLASRFDTGQYGSDEFEVVIANSGSVSIGTSILDRYEITVCATAAGTTERCVTGITLAPRIEP